MSHIMQQYGHLCAQFFVFRNGYPLSLEYRQRITHQMVCAEGMMKTGVHSAGVYEVGKSHFLYPRQSLVEWMPDHFKYQGMIDGNKSINRVINNFMRSCAHFDFVKRNSIQAPNLGMTG